MGDGSQIPLNNHITIEYGEKQYDKTIFQFAADSLHGYAPM